MWTVVVHPRVKKDLARVPKEDIKRLLSAMRSLENFPDTKLNVKLIKGLKYSKYRILRARVGEYRIVFVPIWSERKNSCDNNRQEKERIPAIEENDEIAATTTR